MSLKKIVIIWDYDGTLVDSGTKNLNVTKKIVEIVLGNPSYRFPVLNSVEVYIRTITAQPNWRKFYAESFGMNEDQIDEAGRLWTEQQSLDTTDCPLLPGVKNVLEELSGYKQGIVSQNSRKIINENLEAKNVLHHFDIIVGYEEVGLREQKPNPKGLLTATRKLSEKDETILYVGDQQSDIECAQNASLYLRENDPAIKLISVFITDGYTHHNIIPKPDHVISHPCEICEIIKNLE